MSYSIVTPTKNEGRYIESLIKSVINQEVLPTQWFIMDDGSTDQTELIVKTYLQKYPFIQYHKLNNFRPDLVNTGGRVAAIINYADDIKSQAIDFIVKMDADTSFQSDFFKKLLAEFDKNPNLAVASGHLVENGVPEVIKDRKSGRGANIVIRYSCFLEIGRFYVSKTRGEDVMCFVACRAKGWQTATFDHYFNHLKPEGVRHSKLYNQRLTGYYKGSIPYYLPFYLTNLIRDAFKKPYFLGSIYQFYGFIMAYLIHRYRPFPKFAAKQLQKEQRQKLVNLFK